MYKKYFLHFSSAFPGTATKNVKTYIFRQQYRRKMYKPRKKHRDFRCLFIFRCIRVARYLLVTSRRILALRTIRVIKISLLPVCVLVNLNCFFSEKQISFDVYELVRSYFNVQLIFKLVKPCHVPRYVQC